MRHRLDSDTRKEEAASLWIHNKTQKPMAEELIIDGKTKQERYAQLLPQIEALVQYESDTIANMANIAAALHATFGFLWVGFYRVVGDELVLAPFQGSLACTRIKRGRGVCGTAWQRQASVVVADVEQFEGHIACSSLSRSEIVVPIFFEGTVVGVLDIDSSSTDTFDQTDQHYLEQIAQLLSARKANQRSFY